MLRGGRRRTQIKVLLIIFVFRKKGTNETQNGQDNENDAAENRESISFQPMPCIFPQRSPLLKLLRRRRCHRIQSWFDVLHYSNRSFGLRATITMSTSMFSRMINAEKKRTVPITNV